MTLDELEAGLKQLRQQIGDLSDPAEVGSTPVVLTAPQPLVYCWLHADGITFRSTNPGVPLPGVIVLAGGIGA